MTYMIDARLKHGLPSVTLIDAETGEPRLCWQGNSRHCAERDWKALFKSLVLLSCTDNVSSTLETKLSMYSSSHAVGSCIGDLKRSITLATYVENRTLQMSPK